MMVVVKNSRSLPLRPGFSVRQPSCLLASPKIEKETCGHERGVAADNAFARGTVEFVVYVNVPDISDESYEGKHGEFHSQT
jgi:hypothetical protein